MSALLDAKTLDYSHTLDIWTTFEFDGSSLNALNRRLSRAGRVDLTKDGLLEKVIQGQGACTGDTPGL